MRSWRRRTFASIGALATVIVIGSLAGAATGDAHGRSAYGRDSARITNPYLPISKSHRCVLRGDDQGQRLRIVRVLRPRTKVFRLHGQRVRTAVVRDSVTDLDAHRLIERTIDYFAQDRGGGVHYFGEQVDEFEPGKPVSHGGQWLVGRDDARPGLLMPAHPRVGRRFKSEQARGIAIESDRVIAKGGTETVRGHTYHHVIKIREHATFPKPDEVEFKTYAPGAGVLTEANGGVGLIGCQ